MQRREFVTMGLAAAVPACFAAVVPEVDPKTLSVPAFEAAVKTLEATTLFDDAARKAALATIQKHIYAMRTAKAFGEYMRGGEKMAPAKLKALLDANPPLWWMERSFEKVFKEFQETKVTGDTPAVWYLYNMGVVVKTKTVSFGIDICHRLAPRLAPLLDFALITHNHDDHWRPAFYAAMNGAGKTVVSNFLDNYGVKDWRKDGGFTRAEKEFQLKDVAVRTSSVDHNGYLVDFTTAFEVRVGDWLLYHTGDCGNAAKLRTTWGRPDLWLFFPGCGVKVDEAVGKIGAKRTVFGHFWELGHRQWRLSTPLIRAACAKAESVGTKPELPLWGARIA